MTGISSKEESLSASERWSILTASAETGMSFLKSKEIVSGTSWQIPATIFGARSSAFYEKIILYSVFEEQKEGIDYPVLPIKITVYEVLTSLRRQNFRILEQDEMNQLGRQKTFWSELDEQVRSFLTVPLTDFVKKSDTSVFSKDIMYYI